MSQLLQRSVQTFTYCPAYSRQHVLVTRRCNTVQCRTTSAEPRGDVTRRHALALSLTSSLLLARSVQQTLHLLADPLLVFKPAVIRPYVRLTVLYNVQHLHML